MSSAHCLYKLFCVDILYINNHEKYHQTHWRILPVFVGRGGACDFVWSQTKEFLRFLKVSEFLTTEDALIIQFTHFFGLDLP